MARHGGGIFDATTKSNDALKLKIADGEVLILIDTTAVQGRRATMTKKLMAVASGVARLEEVGHGRQPGRGDLVVHVAGDVAAVMVSKQ